MIEKMKLHILKIKARYLKDILEGRKSFELRKNDRDFQVGDLIHFIEINGLEYEIKDNLYIITYVLKNVIEYGLNDGYAILSIKPVKEVDNNVD